MAFLAFLFPERFNYFSGSCLSGHFPQTLKVKKDLREGGGAEEDKTTLMKQKL